MARRRSARRVASEGQLSFDDIEAVKVRIEEVRAASPPSQNRCPGCTRIHPPLSRNRGLCAWCQLRLDALSDESA